MIYLKTYIFHITERLKSRFEMNWKHLSTKEKVLIRDILVFFFQTTFVLVIPLWTYHNIQICTVWWNIFIWCTYEEITTHEDFMWQRKDKGSQDGSICGQRAKVNDHMITMFNDLCNRVLNFVQVQACFLCQIMSLCVFIL